jgi:hypothetical protein
VYVNHRPVYGTQRKDIQEAFNVLGADPLTGSIQNAHYFKMLMHYGEKMDDFEVDKCLSILKGEEISHRTFDTQFTAIDFAENLLGFEDYEDDAVPERKAEATLEDENAETEVASENISAISDLEE